MRVITRNSYEQSAEIADVAIFCDVFRASTTLLTIMSRGPEEIILTNDESTAQKYVEGGALLFSEVFRGGFDNSPTQAKTVDFSGKTVVHKSTNLTNAIFSHQGFKRGLIGGFVNINALVAFVKKNTFDCVEIVAASHFARGTEAIEDISCVGLIAELCRGDFCQGKTRQDIPRISEIQMKLALKKSRGDYSNHYFTDAEFALSRNEFNFLAEIVLIDAKSMQLLRIDMD